MCSFFVTGSLLRKFKIFLTKVTTHNRQSCYFKIRNVLFVSSLINRQVCLAPLSKSYRGPRPSDPDVNGATV